ncbi:MAG TPA: PEP-CTERM sorting domain-containing protein [Verrucomicrobiota bacterium]|nr:PEP-CTERM sorting domain-containing protein [Verrucomicrobiota bacterium]HNU52487.1 PEP-CTERM sorting domain-containing protein [Verrucomicrobiota bacterium]
MKRILTLLSATAALGFPATAQVYLDEPFAYADGQLSAVSGGAWVNHSGSTPLNVIGGAAFINQADQTSGLEDVNRGLTSGGSAFSIGPDGNENSSDNYLYAGFTVNFAALPGGQAGGATGSYFAHFKSSKANVFYTRLGANVTDAAPETFRLGLGSATWSATVAQFPEDLTLGVTYSIVTRLNLDTGASTLWVNPVDELSLSVDAKDTFAWSAGETVVSYALRQGTTGSSGSIDGPGQVYVDNLKVARTFAEANPTVIPEPGTWALLITGLAGITLWRRRA